MSGKPRRRFRGKVLGGVAVAAGVLLLVFEAVRPGASASNVERWFWMAIALAVVGLGVMELMSPPPDEE